MAVIHLPSFKDKENRFYRFGEYMTMDRDIYFVFGSNLVGIHGKGAALTARTDYGAKIGVGVGFTGKSYAIPTKDKNLKVLPLLSIERYVKEFIKVTKTGIYCFYITPIGTGLAQYSHEEIAPMFKEVENCWLPDIWRQYLL